MPSFINGSVLYALFNVFLVHAVYRLNNTDNLLLAIQDKIKWADSMSDLDRKHKKEVEEKAEELRKSIKVSGVRLGANFFMYR